MRRHSILHRYIFFEMFPPFLLNLAFLTFVFLMTQILEITNMIVNYHIRLWDVVRMLLFTMPFFLEFVIPMSVMMAVLLTFLRMSGDNEIIALKSGGVNLYALVPPVLAFCFIAAILTAVMAVYGLPWGRTSAKDLLYEVAESNIDIGLKERTFNDQFEGVMLYVSKIDMKTKKLIDVFIEDQRDKKTVSSAVAPEGRIFSDPDALTYHLRLFNGIINRVDLDGHSVHTIQFDTYDVSLDMKTILARSKGGPKDEEEMSFGELRDYIDNRQERDDRYYLALMEFHKKMSIPMACFALGLLAIPLGVQSRITKRSFGIGLGLIFFLLYYMLLSAGWVFGEAGVYPPLIGMWAPNLVMGGIGIVMLMRSANERRTGIESILSLKGRIVTRWRKGGRQWA